MIVVVIGHRDSSCFRLEPFIIDSDKARDLVGCSLAMLKATCPGGNGDVVKHLEDCLAGMAERQGELVSLVLDMFRHMCSELFVCKQQLPPDAIVKGRTGEMELEFVRATELLECADNLRDFIGEEIQ